MARAITFRAGLGVAAWGPTGREPAARAPGASSQRAGKTVANPLRTWAPVPVTAPAELSDRDDLSLVRACLEGRPGAFDLIVERHQRAVYQLCYRYVGTHEDAADLTQDVFLRAYRGLSRFRGHSTLATWLYRIGVNVCLNRIASRRPAAESLDDNPHLADGSPGPAAKLLAAERAARVRAAIARLPAKQRTTLILRIYQELSHQEIAEVVGSSVGAVKANFFHALNNLRRMLGDQEL